MRAICAWCQSEGRPADLGQREPFDDTSETHGLCQRHLAQLLGGLPSRSFPGVQLLIVVTSGDRSLYEYLTGVMAEVGGVQVIRERRQGERRREYRSVSTERRLVDRRRHRGITHGMGCAFVRFGQGSEPALKL
ncbi:MAG TPA: hypothetical protein VFO18_00150 [Methylomirabilota bacterium]|nr:hypothetical protein [Methylomirabilota bacterium]